MSRVDVSWSPNTNNQFLIVQNNDIALYKLDRYSSFEVGGGHKSLNSVSQSVSVNSTATLLTKNTDVAFVKSYDCHPSLEHEHLIAVGHANGRVLLTSPFLANTDNWLGREFVPKHSRACLSLAWNPKNPWLLAIGLDRYRADNSIFIWDLTSRPVTIEQPPLMTTNVVNEHMPQTNAVGSDHRRVQSFAEYAPGPPSNASGSSHHSRALNEMASSESAVSLAWLRQNPRVLLCGLSGKYIKLFDLRDTSKAQSSISTKAVHGLTLDPFNDHRVCSYYDNQIMLWDLRHTDKPQLIISDQKPITKIRWDPIRRNVLSSLCRDSSTVRVFHLQQIVEAQETEVSFIETYVQPRFVEPNQTTAASFVWHPSDENRVVVVGNNGEISDVMICERLPIDWNCDGTLIASFPKHLSEYPFLSTTESSKNDFLHNDVSYKMKQRAIQGYGADSPHMFRRAVELCKDEPDLQWLWNWLDKMKSISSEDTETWSYDVKFPGALTIFRMPFGRGGSSTEYRSIFGLDMAGYSPMTKLYVSPERDRLLHLCGWGSMNKERSPFNDPFIQKLIEDDEIERAAAIALFTLRLKLSIQILNTAASSSESRKNLQLVALSLSGFPGSSEKETNYLSGSGGGTTSTQTPSLWLDMCHSILANIDNAYLKAMFLFLASKCTSSNSFDGVMELNDLPVYDKIAFAAVHLPDVSLNEVLERLYRQCLSTSTLLGIIICGFGTNESLQLIESYIDQTGDVQSAALLLIATGSNRPPESNGPTDDQSRVAQFGAYKRVDEIIGAYLNLLNRWCLWHVRAQTEFPLIKSDDKNGSKTAAQVYLTCTFCSKSVWSAGSGRPRQRMNKLGSCPTCKKPLPRCSLCRFHMGTPLHGEENKFGTWFSWCQTCRHGGHAQHLTEWFQEHEECPVTGCSCKCASLDLSSCGN